LRKNGMRAGDVLVLTKPIGTGTLFAAHAKPGRQRAVGLMRRLQSMVVSNRMGAKCLREHSAPPPAPT
jgi:selenide,water dikinase